MEVLDVERDHHDSLSRRLMLMQRERSRETGSTEKVFTASLETRKRAAIARSAATEGWCP